MESRDNILSINDLHVSYPGNTDILRGVTFSIKRGSMVSIIGTNGAGKTTLLNAISGIIEYNGGKITGGDINFKGKRIDNLKPVQIIRKGIVHILEGRREFSSLTIEENLCLGSFARLGTPSNKGFDIIYRYFPALMPKKKTLAADCGPGELQMLAIGRALMAQPELILLDEPYPRISPVLAEELFTALGQINREKGIAIIFVERTPSMSFQVTDDVLEISDGVIFHPDKGIIDSSGLRARL